MAFTYSWGQLLELVKKTVKQIPTSTVDVLECDQVSSRIAIVLPWKFLRQTIADGQIPLIDGVQDYDPPLNMWRLGDNVSLRCVSITPNQDVSISIRDSLPVDLYKRTPRAITSIALQAGVGQLRLSCAPAIPVNERWEIRGEYQVNTKVTSLDQKLWLDDRYLHVALSGLTAHYMELADDPRAGSVSATWGGQVAFTGKEAKFMAGIKEMSDAEDIGGDMQMMPDGALGISSNQYGPLIIGMGTGGTTTPTFGVVSVNNDTQPAQWLVGGPGISVIELGNGYHQITNLGGGGGGGGPVINFADNVAVTGSGTIWTLPNVPNPSASLQLFQQLTGFGQVLLKVGVDYTLAGLNIVTVNSLAAGSLRAWYRF